MVEQFILLFIKDVINHFVINFLVLYSTKINYYYLLLLNFLKINLFRDFKIFQINDLFFLCYVFLIHYLINYDIKYYFINDFLRMFVYYFKINRN